MTEAELLALIKEGESLHLEFKRDAPLCEADLVEAVACLANTEGGWLLTERALRSSPKRRLTTDNDTCRYFWGRYNDTCHYLRIKEDP
jgi:hypothetical protein